MRAVTFPGPGGPEVVIVADRPVRKAGAGEVRIAVKAAAVNPTDIVLREHGTPDTPPPWVPGMDLAGTVESVGEGVERLCVGDAVMAAVNPRRPEGGAQAELVVVPAAAAVAIPEGVSLAAASTLPMNGLTARLGIEELALSAGMTLAVTGGAGVLASYVIPLAKERGLRVIADAKPEDEDLVRRFGADVVVLRGADPAAAIRAVAPDGVHGVYDTAVLRRAVLPAIRDGGGLAVIRGWDEEGPPGRDIALHVVLVRTVLQRTDWLEELRQLASAGRLTLRVAREYPPEEAAEAERVMDAGGLRGRAVIVFQPHADERLR